MKLKIILAIILILAVVFAVLTIFADAASPIDEKINEQKTIKDKAHQAANLLRDLGYAESSVEIKGLQAKWTEAHTELKRLEKYEYMGSYSITGYDACYSCCGKTDGITASGTKATAGRTVAMKGVPFGTKIYIDGIGERVVEDRGVGYGTVDVYCDTHAECYAITGRYDVYMVNE
jgi:3D (Asp-Asp-Asp) domain-containing protein